MSDIPKNIRLLGQISGHTASANLIAIQMTNAFSQIKKQNQSKAKVRVFYQLWTRPLMTISSGMINEMISLCGGENIFSVTLGNAPEVSVEAVVAANPQVIIATDTESNWQRTWSSWSIISAVKHQNLFTLPVTDINGLGLDMINGTRLICADLDKARQKL